MDKDKVVYIYTIGYYSVIKKREILKYITMWMNSEDIMLSEVNQLQ